MLILFCSTEAITLLPYVEYFINYKHISEVLCINKDKPVLSCNGKCYLNDQLLLAQENENEEEELPLVKVERFSIIPFGIQQNTILIPLSYSLEQNGLYQFANKEWNISPPNPPPKC